jgi:hypothetical protein
MHMDENPYLCHLISLSNSIISGSLPFFNAEKALSAYPRASLAKTSIGLSFMVQNDTIKTKSIEM